jgi:tartrate dehydratase alpha subunit/fumarate hydratase class I-like protein
MTHEYYEMESQRLREVLADAVERGDYYLEMDVKEALEKLRARYYNEGDEE